VKVRTPVFDMVGKRFELRTMLRNNISVNSEGIEVKLESRSQFEDSLLAVEVSENASLVLGHLDSRSVKYEYVHIDFPVDNGHRSTIDVNQYENQYKNMRVMVDTDYYYIYNQSWKMIWFFTKGIDDTIYMSRYMNFIGSYNQNIFTLFKVTNIEEL
jgi:hypothetical protein